MGEENWKDRKDRDPCILIAQGVTTGKRVWGGYTGDPILLTPERRMPRGKESIDPRLIPLPKEKGKS